VYAADELFAFWLARKKTNKLISKEQKRRRGGGQIFVGSNSGRGEACISKNNSTQEKLPNNMKENKIRHKK